MGEQESLPQGKLGKYRLYQGDVMDGLSKIPNGKIQCCVTSPPYFGLRDYGTAKWEGGDPGCDHSVGGQVQDSKAPGAIVSGVRPGCDASKCKKCGAIRVDSQIGLEPTPDAYVAKLVAVFREVRRVLRDDGTLWLNLGDSYATGTKADRQQSTNPGVGSNNPEAQNSVPRIGTPVGLKTKDLIGIPWRVAFALQADGWYLRQDIIWHKPNPMPESVRDRCTKSHEYVFLLSKNQRYFYDFDAMQEPAVCAGQNRGKSRNISAEGMTTMEAKQYDTRNRRSVWTIPTRPYKEAHFATMTPALAEVCVLAGSSPGSIVLDPFGGSGTTAEVAMKHGRNAVLCELNPEYCEITKKRLGDLK